VSALALVTTIAVGAALLAVWCLVRWPELAPRTFGRALLHGIVAFSVLPLSAIVFGFAAGRSRELAAIALITFVVPALSYAFLAALWVMRLFAEAFKGV